MASPRPGPPRNARFRQGTCSSTPGGSSGTEDPPGVFVPGQRRREVDHCPSGTEVTAISAVKQPEVRVNERIRVPQVRVIGEDGSQIGVLATREALALAQSKALDLVEVAATSRPPVCRIMDYGKFKYEQNRRARKAKKKQHQMQLKEVKMRPKVEKHDYDFKIVHAREFLADRDKVKLTVTFRGREIAHQDLGYKLIQRAIADLAEFATVESAPRSEGRTLTAVLMPRPSKTGGKAEDAETAAPPARPSTPKAAPPKAAVLADTITRTT
jgi:translation initiation factor IF-3